MFEDMRDALERLLEGSYVAACATMPPALPRAVAPKSFHGTPGEPTMPVPLGNDNCKGEWYLYCLY